MSAPRTRAPVCVAVLSAVLVLGAAGTALAAGHPYCRGSTPQARMQTVLDADRPDVYRLDGIACESLPRHGTDGGEGRDVPATTPPTVPLDVPGVHCAAFGTQADAQAALQHSTERGLDADDDGIACEQHFGTEGQQVAVHPEGGVSTGGAVRL